MFAFLPRVVSRRAGKCPDISAPLLFPTSDDGPDDDEGNDEKRDESPVQHAKPRQSTLSHDIVTLISLVLSDYNIWLDPDLRWKLDTRLQADVSPDDAGFVPIKYLLRRPPFRDGLTTANGQPDPSETEVVKILRTHASRTLEVRMRLPPPASSFASSSIAAAPASSVWYGTGKTSRKKDVGGYEVRRRDWATLRDRPSRGWSRARWDDVTAYMECIPPQYRSMGGIAHFAEALLCATEAEADPGPLLRVQCVALPPHYLDKPGDTPKCKGYALVTFSTKSDLEAVLHAWPWRRLPPSSPDHDDASPVVKEAYKYGLRAISKARWDALNEEYLAYKYTLVEEMTRGGTDMQRANRDGHKPGASPNPQTQSEMETHTTLSSPYPFDCLVFVRNVHPDTNKTMLKSLFSQAFQDQDHDGRTPATGLDYVDFNKGTDMCYLRLACPPHTTRLLAYFTAHPKTQAHGLDAIGRMPLADDKPIAMERVQGKKEEVYWEKIPDKVRRQAVEKVVHVQTQRTDIEMESELATGRNGDSGSKRKKRTRKY